jgi:hypothetical protein
VSPTNRVQPAMYVLVGISMALLVAAAAITCEKGATVTYVNNTDKVLFVEISGGGQKRIEPHSKLRLGKIGLEDDPYIITVRDQAGNIVYYEESTFREVEERDCPIVVEDPSPWAE